MLSQVGWSRLTFFNYSNQSIVTPVMEHRLVRAPAARKARRRRGQGRNQKISILRTTVRMQILHWTLTALSRPFLQEKKFPKHKSMQFHEFWPMLTSRIHSYCWKTPPFLFSGSFHPHHSQRQPQLRLVDLCWCLPPSSCGLGWGAAQAPAMEQPLFPPHREESSCWDSAGPSVATVRGPHPTGLVTETSPGRGTMPTSFPIPLDSLLFCTLNTGQERLYKVEGFFFLIFILFLVFILLNTLCISYFLFFHWLSSQVNATQLILHFLGEELGLTPLDFKKKGEDYRSLWLDTKYQYFRAVIFFFPHWKSFVPLWCQMIKWMAWKDFGTGNKLQRLQEEIPHR